MPALIVQPQRLVECFPVPADKWLQIPRAASAGQIAQHSHQQQQPLRLTQPATKAAIRDDLEKADQITRSALIVCSVSGFWYRVQQIPPTVGETFSGEVDYTVIPTETSSDRLLGGPVHKVDAITANVDHLTPATDLIHCEEEEVVNALAPTRG